MGEKRELFNDDNAVTLILSPPGYHAHADRRINVHRGKLNFATQQKDGQGDTFPGCIPEKQGNEALPLMKMVAFPGMI